MPSKAAIAAVTFDVGGTLIEPWPSVGDVYAEVARQRGLAQVNPGRLNRQFARAWAGRQRFDYSRQAWKQLVRHTFLDSLSETEVDSLFPHLYDHFALAQPWRLFADVIPTLEALRQSGFRLGILSNWDERLRPLLGRMRLDTYFEVMAISHEVGFAKPSRPLFDHAAQTLGLPPSALAHVGDSRCEDCQGARAAGWNAFWLRRTGPLEPGALRSLTDLRAALEDVSLGSTGHKVRL